MAPTGSVSCARLELNVALEESTSTLVIVNSSLPDDPLPARALVHDVLLAQVSEELPASRMLPRSVAE